jgi:transposase
MEQTTSRGWRVELEARTPELSHLMKSDPDPRVRHCGHALLLVAQGRAVAEVARLFQTAAHGVRAWRSRFLAEGRAGLVDRSRCGRPPKLDAGARRVLEEALDRGPQAYGLPMTIWSLRDLHRRLLQEGQVQVSLDTVHRAVGALGYRYRRPRHDSTPSARSPGRCCGSAGAGVAGKKSAAEPERLHLVFVDEGEVHTHPGLAKVWQRRGHSLKAPAAGEDEKFVV